MLRLAQQYFFVSCSLQDMIRIHLLRRKSLDTFHENFAVQLNDTHPAIAVAELMRLLVDEHRLAWEQAWEITRNTLAYTNHTLLPGGPGEVAAAALCASSCPGTWKSSMRSTAAFWTRCACRYPGDEDRVQRGCP